MLMTTLSIKISPKSCLGKRPTTNASLVWNGLNL